MPVSKKAGGLKKAPVKKTTVAAKTPPSPPVVEPKQAEERPVEPTFAPVMEQAANTPPAPPTEPAAPEPRKKKVYTVKFHSQEGAGGKDDIVIHAGTSTNIGRNWRIKREVEVQLPEEAMQVIFDAKYTIYETDERTKRSSKKEVDRYAYTIIRVE